MMPWGVENMTIAERYQKALNAGVDIFSGSADPTSLIEVAKKEWFQRSVLINQ